MADIRIPTSPLEARPDGAIGYETGHLAAALREALTTALDGIELGSYDRQMIDWAVETWDQPTMATVCSWLLRARGPRRPSVGGGPDIGPDADREYRDGQADYEGEGA